MLSVQANVPSQPILLDTTPVVFDLALLQNCGLLQYPSGVLRKSRFAVACVPRVVPQFALASSLGPGFSDHCPQHPAQGGFAQATPPTSQGPHRIIEGVLS